LNVFRFGLTEIVQNLHIIVFDVKIENLGILEDPGFVTGFRYRDEAVLQRPPDHDLSRRLRIFSGDLGDDRIVQFPAPGQRAIGFKSNIF
jgi:hypothetical protein